MKRQIEVPRSSGIFGVTLIFVISLLSCASHAQSNASTAQDDEIIASVIEYLFSGRGYTVVDPVTSTKIFEANRKSGGIRKIEYINKIIQVDGYDLSLLVDRLYRRNIGQALLSIQSAPRLGYLVDYDGEFKRYFEPGGGGWDKWRKESPKARGMTRVSLPAYDEQKGIVLIYVETQLDWNAGAGYIYAMKMLGRQKVKELGRGVVWIY
ncbi:MAG: hypothetical protein ABW117_17725 [Candidatus Sedimenticola sp. 1PA]